MKLFKYFGVLALGLAMAACSNAKFEAINFPANYLHGADIKVQKNVAFGTAPWQKLDIYRPVSQLHRPWPVVVFYYGGRWEQGRKKDYAFVGSTLAQQGYLVVIADYRKFPEVKFPQMEDDVAASLAWVYGHINDYGGRVGPVHLMGHSAGAQMASLLATDPEYLRKYGLEPKTVIKDFVGLAGPYAFTPDEPDLKQIFGPESHYPKMQATTYVDGKQPPMLLLWGEQDKEVGKQNIERMFSKIKDKGGCVEVKTYKDLTHVTLLTSLSFLRGLENHVLPDAMNFMKGNQCAKPGPVGELDTPDKTGKKKHSK